MPRDGVDRVPTVGNVARSVACTGGFGTSRRMIRVTIASVPFRADEQVRQVVADDVLHGLAAGLDDLAGRQHGFEAEHVVLRSRRT